MTDHPKVPASATRRQADHAPDGGKAQPGVQAYGLAAGEPREESTGLVAEHKALVEKLGHRTAPDNDLGEPAEPMPDPTGPEDEA
ncbi:hypothetical protein [Phenylobacterium sp.]|uniref:hypothetical protein n=1 Tax=Phenylobacterium sp. TaxID=1871053 RepID=UPI002FDB1B07